LATARTSQCADRAARAGPVLDDDLGWPSEACKALAERCARSMVASRCPA
jgi:hypothetical protein